MHFRIFTWILLACYMFTSKQSKDSLSKPVFMTDQMQYIGYGQHLAKKNSIHCMGCLSTVLICIEKIK